MAGKKKKGEGHHGGAWKVAYADFVTAMMALFMVLWISAQDKEILIATSKYFQNPFKSPMERSSGVLESNQASVARAIVDSSQASLTDLALLNKLSKEIYRQLNVEEDKDRAPIDVQITGDGLRVVVFDRHDKPLFTPGKADFTEWGGFVMENLAWLIDQREFKVRIDGHTASGFVPAESGYSAWELSSDRANATRRALQYYAVAPGKIERVTGFADTVPLSGKSPDSPANQRIELSLILVKPLRSRSP